MRIYSAKAVTVLFLLYIFQDGPTRRLGVHRFVRSCHIDSCLWAVGVKRGRGRKMRVQTVAFLTGHQLLQWTLPLSTCGFDSSDSPWCLAKPQRIQWRVSLCWKGVHSYHRGRRIFGYLTSVNPEPPAGWTQRIPAKRRAAPILTEGRRTALRQSSRRRQDHGYCIRARQLS